MNVVLYGHRSYALEGVKGEGLPPGPATYAVKSRRLTRIEPSELAVAFTGTLLIVDATAPLAAQELEFDAGELLFAEECTEKLAEARARYA